MKRILGASLAAALTMALPPGAAAQGTPATVVDPAGLTEARAIVDAVLPPGQREQTFSQVMRDMGSQMRGALLTNVGDDPGIRRIIDNYLDRMPDRLMPVVRVHIPHIVEAMALAYTREFSIDELKQIRAFAETPAGSHYLSRSAALIGDPAVAQANMAYLADVRKSLESVRGQLVDEVKAYLEAQSGTASGGKAKVQPAN